ncbi:hypothetical protein C8R47DRAFT_1077328 [Mycena vitilis]|nr:hypothetical protein C8R47DRAFT_1077328 [Mycena vitilis]
MLTHPDKEPSRSSQSEAALSRKVLAAVHAATSSAPLPAWTNWGLRKRECRPTGCRPFGRTGLERRERVFEEDELGAFPSGFIRDAASAMPVTLPDDVAASLLAALAATNATSLSPSFGDLRNILLSSTQPNTDNGPSNTSSQQRMVPSRAFVVSRPQIYATPSQHLGPRNILPTVQYRGRRATSVPLADRPLWEGFSRGSVPSLPVRVHETLLPTTTTPTRLSTRTPDTLTPVSTTTSPTLYENSPDDPRLRQCVSSPPGRLSPLRFDVHDSDTDTMDLGDNDTVRPTPPRKRTAAGALLSDQEDSDSEEEQPLLQHYLARVALRVSAGAAKGAAAVAAAGDGGGGGGGAGDVPVARWPCPRKGDAARVGEAQAIGMMPCNEPDCDDCSNRNDPTYSEGRTRTKNNTQKGSRKLPRLSREDAWTVDDDGAPITLRAGDLLSEMLSIFGHAQRQALDSILESRSTYITVLTAPSSFDIPTLVARIKEQTDSLQLAELQHMLTLVQLALSIDCLQRDRAAKYLPKMTQDDLAKTYAAGTVRRTFVNWLVAGRKLLLLCAAGTMYILPLISALKMRTAITGRSSSPADIESLAKALRRVKHGMWLPMVRRLMIPIKYMQSHNGLLQSLRLNYDEPVGVAEQPRSELISFDEIPRMDQVLDGVETNLLKLPARSAEWSMANVLPWTRTNDPSKVPLPKLRKVKTPFVFKKTPSPVNKKNRDSFTEEQRGYASKATVVTSIDDFVEKSSELHAGGKVVPNTYLQLNTKMLNGEALYIGDTTGEFVALLYRVPEEFRQKLVYAMDAINAAMPGEFKDEDSRRKFFKYLSIHYVWYARYGEKVWC